MQTPKTNGDFLADLYRQEIALRSPKAHIPLGIGTFMVLAAMSPLAWLPFAGAGLIAYDAERRLRKNRKLVETSYRNPGVLFEKLKKDERELVDAFLAEYPISAPFGTKKALPPRQPKAQPQTVSAKSEGEISDPNQTKPNPSLSIKAETEPAQIDDGWQPADLPQPFIPYLASQVHILIAATTGSGKTWVLRNLCTHIANRGDLICIADPKGTQWGELAPAAKFMQTGEDYLRLFDHLSSELNRRRTLLSQGKPVGKHLWVVLDEWFLMQSEAKGLESADRMAMENLLVKLIAAGRELNLHLIMVGQSHLLGDLSLSPGKNTFSSGLRDSICVLALGCKETKDNAGNPMQGNSKTIDGVMADPVLIKDKGDREAAQSHHAALRRQPDVNRTYAIHASRLYVGQTPDLIIPDLVELAPFPKVES